MQSAELSQTLILASRCSNKCIFPWGWLCSVQPALELGLTLSSGCRRNLSKLCLLEGSCRLGCGELGKRINLQEESHGGNRARGMLEVTLGSHHTAQLVTIGCR